MPDKLTPSQLRSLRRALAFAIVLLFGDILVIGVLLWQGLIELPH